MECPVCNFAELNERDEFCSRCGWELKVLSVEVSEKERAKYETRLQICRKNWAMLQKIRLSVSEDLLKEIDTDEDGEKVNNSSFSCNTGGSDKKIYSTENEIPPLEIPVFYPPDLNRDPFETSKEFAFRKEETLAAFKNNKRRTIDALKEKFKDYPLPAGKGFLHKEKYDIDTGYFPVSIKWKGWVERSSLNINTEAQNSFLSLDRDRARALYESSNESDIYLTLDIENDNRLVVKKVELAGPTEVYAIMHNVWKEPVTGMEFVTVPGGSFLMGDLFEDGDANEKPVHKVFLDNFYIGKYPVTQGQWKTLMGNNPSHFQLGDNFPVETVSWNEVQRFIKKLNEATGKNYRLPTEAEWEYAARSGGKKEKYAGGNDVLAVACFDSNSGGQPQPVGSKDPNGLDIYDMSGNVWEWCNDWYEADYYSKSVDKNPKGPSYGTERVERGGSWCNDLWSSRTAVRSKLMPNYRNDYLGFRVVLSAINL